MADSSQSPPGDTGTWKKSQSQFSKYVLNLCLLMIATTRPNTAIVNATANTSTPAKKPQTRV